MNNLSPQGSITPWVSDLLPFQWSSGVKYDIYLEEKDTDDLFLTGDMCINSVILLDPEGIYLYFCCFIKTTIISKDPCSI